MWGVMSDRIKVLDHGYVQLIEAWGSDESIIEAARMSTGKGFQGWGKVCEDCGGNGYGPDRAYGPEVTQDKCDACDGKGLIPGDERLLKFLYTHKHMTPFEMAGAIVEVKAPIFVFREWHRHRTQSYNEMSARYIPLPDENYLPEVSDVVTRSGANANKQASGSKKIDEIEAAGWLIRLRRLYEAAQAVYEEGIEYGVPKELARLSVPVARYSRMRASANLRNWLQFLELRTAQGAQKEIRLYAKTLDTILSDVFPRTMELFHRDG